MRALACVLVRAFVCVCKSVCVRACARARLCVRVRVRAWVCCSIGKHLRARVVRACACVCVCGTTVCVRLGAEWALRDHAVLIARPAAARAWLRSGATGRGVARLVAGRTFSNRTLKAEWAARYGHTSVIDAVSGAIYVIGGSGGSTFLQDVWASTDGGARPDSVGGSGVHWVGTTGVLQGY
jgi:hypothetical protein